MKETVKYYYTKPITFYSSSMFILDGVEQISMRKVKQEGKRMTLAGIWNEDTGEVRFGMSICHEKDKFKKKTGQQIAEKNARENPILIISHFSGDFKDYLNLVRHTGHMEERKFYKKYYNHLLKNTL